jgi:ATP-dependent Lhr-like helicase
MMVTSPPSSSDELASAFDRLHPEIRRWVYQKGWSELRDVQALGIDAILTSTSDVVISAATAAGKTEAAFLPILTETIADNSDGFRAMYVGPLKALINDQFLRLDDLCATLKVPVSKWHGDVSVSVKRRAREKPAGILLITPESLEALFVRRPDVLARMFARLSFVVIDELHAFLSSERGVQLASLLKRLDQRLGRSPRRIGLSATIGDLGLAASWLRPSDPASVRIVNASGSQADLKLQIRGIKMPPRQVGRPAQKVDGTPAELPEENALRQIASHLYATLRAKGNHLVFTARRKDVESLADKLRVDCEANAVPNEFFPHHGSLSREIREVLETRLKDGLLPTTAIATSTLELGVDIGAVESVAQVGPPRLVSALRQRLGRSGRRLGKSAVLRMYAIESELDERSSLVDRLRLETILAIALTELLLELWIEPPSPLTQHLSTLLHQVLSMIVEKGGISAKDAYDILAGPGPFASIDIDTFKALLRGMRATDPPLLEQASDGTLMLGPLGERLTDSYEFFAVFNTPEEFRIVTQGQTLGTISIQNAFGPGDYIVFSGRRWRVLDVDDRTRTVQVEAAPAGRVPQFDGTEAGALHDVVVAKMRVVLVGTSIPVYLDKTAAAHLQEARSAFQEVGLGELNIAADDDEFLLFPWKGTKTLDALRFALRQSGLSVTPASICLAVPAKDRDVLRKTLQTLAGASRIDGAELAQFDENLERAKYDSYIPRELLRHATAVDRLDVTSIPAVCRELSQALDQIKMH